jgi:hypothetical protein
MNPHWTKTINDLLKNLKQKKSLVNKRVAFFIYYKATLTRHIDDDIGPLPPPPEGEVAAPKKKKRSKIFYIYF